MPSSPETEALRGALLWRLGQPVESALEAEAEALNTLGLLERSSGNFPQALGHFRRAATLWLASGERERWAGALNNQAVAHAELGEDAQVAFSQALEAAGDHPVQRSGAGQPRARSRTARSDRVIEGVCYALGKVDPQKLVLNLSFGGDTPVEAHRVILEYAIAQGAAAGNQGLGGPTHYPAAHDLPGLIAVGALRFDSGSSSWIPADFSTRGAYVEIAAPGEGLTSGNASGSFQQFKGTSFSAPLVAGVVAMWCQAHPKWTPAQIEQAIRDNAIPLPFAASAVGAGMVNVGAQP